VPKSQKLERLADYIRMFDGNKPHFDMTKVIALFPSLDFTALEKYGQYINYESKCYDMSAYDAETEETAVIRYRVIPGRSENTAYVTF
jgi:hypothetical protein